MPIFARRRLAGGRARTMHGEVFHLGHVVVTAAAQRDSHRVRHARRFDRRCDRVDVHTDVDVSGRVLAQGHGLRRRRRVQ